MTKYPICNANKLKAYRKPQMQVSILKHFPLIPQLVRWYKSPKIAKLLRWAHCTQLTNVACNQHQVFFIWKRFPKHSYGVVCRWVQSVFILSMPMVNLANICIYITCLLGWPQNILLSSPSYSFQESIHQIGGTLMCTWNQSETD